MRFLSTNSEAVYNMENADSPRLIYAYVPYKGKLKRKTNFDSFLPLDYRLDRPELTAIGLGYAPYKVTLEKWLYNRHRVAGLKENNINFNTVGGLICSIRILGRTSKSSGLVNYLYQLID